jgi:hypothetical protein
VKSTAEAGENSPSWNAWNIRNGFISNLNKSRCESHANLPGPPYIFSECDLGTAISFLILAIHVSLPYIWSRIGGNVSRRDQSHVNTRHEI